MFLDAGVVVSQSQLNQSCGPGGAGVQSRCRIEPVVPHLWYQLDPMAMNRTPEEIRLR
jgi:hypothetical protein